MNLWNILAFVHTAAHYTEDRVRFERLSGIDDPAPRADESMKKAILVSQKSYCQNLLQSVTLKKRNLGYQQIRSRESFLIE